MKTSIFLSACLAAALALTPTAYAQSAGQSFPGKEASTAKGPTLVDSFGMTLYVFDKDVNGKIACVATCAQNWPPLFAQDDAKVQGDFTVVDRGYGARQWAYKGRPLYTWSRDQKPGDITGDGFLNNTWHVAQP